MSCYEVARLIIEQNHRKPLLVAVMGHGWNGDRRRSAEAGIHLHLVDELEDLLETIQKGWSTNVVGI